LRVNGASLGAARFSWMTLGWKPKWKLRCYTSALRPLHGCPKNPTWEIPPDRALLLKRV
jgi:hypothetical protein